MARTATPLTAGDFDQAVAQGVALVDFWAPWCVPCRRQAPVLDRVAAAMDGLALVAKVDVDAEAGLAARFGVHLVPTLVILRGGTERARYTSVQEEATLVEALRAAAAAP